MSKPAKCPGCSKEASEALLQKFQPIFYPRSIAMVGSFGQVRGMGAFYSDILTGAGYTGKLYPVSRSGGEYAGHKVYQDLLSIPDEIDLVYVSIPRHGLLEFLDECALKRVKAVTFFTAGFSELSQEGRELEERMLEKARNGGFLLLGPNCIGPYTPEINLMFTLPVFKGLPGDIAFICQSGSLYIKTVQMGRVRGINYSKGVSYGNGVDLDSADFLEYFGTDPKTKAIMIYIEGVRQAKRFLVTARQVAREKPVIMVRGGRGEAGKRAISSHTGSLTSPESVWHALERQTGIVAVDSMEEMADTALALQKLKKCEGGVVALTGLANGGGGEAVMAADALSLNHLEAPAFSRETQEELGKVLNDVGSILNNPLDVSQAYASPLLISRAAHIALQDPRFSALVALEYFDLHCAMGKAEQTRELNNALIEVAHRLGKKLAMVMPPALNESERIEEEKRLSQAGVPVYPSLERAARALYNLKRLWRR